MSVLITELKDDHVVLVDLLKEIKAIGSISKEAQTKLLEAKDALLGHLKKEDDRLYPVLNKAAKDDQYLQQTIDIFTKDMDDISAKVMAFFEKYTTSGRGIEYFKDFTEVLFILGRRIRKEENILFPAYDKVVE